MKPRRASVRGLIGVLVMGAVLSVAGFLVFASYVTRPLPSDRAVADGIVVLTGGAQRIKTGGELLSDGRGKRLLISGVNVKTSEQDLLRLTGLPASTFDCCVDLGYEATNTIENAEETRDWVIANRYRSIVVVTASYHMPRSLAELGRKLPGITLYAYPVQPERFTQQPWWLDTVTIRTLVMEYAKFLRAAGHKLIAGMLPDTPLPTTTPTNFQKRGVDRQANS